MSGYVEDPAFIRSGKYWSEAPSDIELPEQFHPHDRAWLISILHQIETKQHGAVFEPLNITVIGVSRERWAADYSRVYANTLEETGSESLARRAANTRILGKATVVKNR